MLDPEFFEPVIAAYAATCRILESARTALGSPADTPEWRVAALEALSVIAPAGLAYFQAAKARGYLPEVYADHP